MIALVILWLESRSSLSLIKLGEGVLVQQCMWPDAGCTEGGGDMASRRQVIRGLVLAASCSQMTLACCLNQSGVVQVQSHGCPSGSAELPGASRVPGLATARPLDPQPTHRQPSPTAANMPRAATVSLVQQPPLLLRSIHSHDGKSTRQSRIKAWSR